MGAACDAICSRKASVNHMQPDTKVMKLRRNISATTDGVTQSKNEETNTISAYHITDDSNTQPQLSVSQEFHQVIKEGNDHMVMFYLEEYPSLNLLNTPFTNNDTALHVAVKHKRYNTIQELL
eukprot:UN03516